MKNAAWFPFDLWVVGVTCDLEDWTTPAIQACHHRGSLLYVGLHVGPFTAWVEKRQ